MYNKLKQTMKKLLLFVLVYMSGLSVLLAQSVSGTVTDENGEGIPGVNIVVKGSTTGTITDFDGNYSVDAAEGDVLVVSYVGYSSQEITVGSQSNISIQLQLDVASLDEIVVTGYGNQRRKEVTSAVTTVKESDFNKGLNNNPMGLLQGKVAGLTVSKPGGDPNDGYVLRLRGISTVGANASPLIVIDGVAGGSMDSVDPNDIASIDVIKDGAAAAIYGTRGSSGVILITTKTGSRGVTKVEYNVSGSVDQIAKKIPVMTAAEYLQVPGAVNLGATTDWMDLVTDAGYTHVHNLAISGGNENTMYRVSLNYRNQDGIGIKTGQDRINANLSLTQKALNDKAEFSVNVANTNMHRNFGFKQVFRYATTANPTMPVYDATAAGAPYGGYFERTIFDFFNPLSIAEQTVNEGDDNIFTGTIKGDFDLGGIVTGLKGYLTYTKQVTDVERGAYYKKTARFRGSDRNGLAVTDNQQFTMDIFEGTLDYATNFGTTNLGILAGYRHQEWFNEGYHAEGGNFLTDKFSYYNLAAAQDFANGLGNVYSFANSNKLVAFFGRVNLNFDDNIFINADLNYEGSSKFGANNKWGFFYGVGAGASLDDLFDMEAFDNLKFRVSLGQTGNEPLGSYLSLQRFAPAGSFYYNGAYVSSYGPTSNANADLAWEKTTHTNIGIDFATANSKLFGAVEWFTRTTKDQLLNVTVPVPPNLVSTTLLNIGELTNSGVEVTANYNLVDNSSFSWTTGVNFGTASSKLNKLTLGTGDDKLGTDLLYRAAMGSPGQSAVTLVRVKEGETLGQLWGVVRESINADGSVKFKDIGGPDGAGPDGTFCDCDDDRQVIGNGLPDFSLGWTNTMNIGNLDISMFWNGEFGHDLLSTYRGFYENTEPTTVGNWNVVKTSRYDATVAKAAVDNTHVEKGSYFELNNITLGYTIPTDGAISNFRLYFSAQRPIVITGYEGVDPVARYQDQFDGSQGGGVGSVDPLAIGIERRNTYYRARTFTFGVNLAF